MKAEIDSPEGIPVADSGHGKWRVVESTRQYLRSACAAKGVAFFSHAQTTPAEGAPARVSTGNGLAAVELPVTRRMPALLEA